MLKWQTALIRGRFFLFAVECKNITSKTRKAIIYFFIATISIEHYFYLSHKQVLLKNHIIEDILRNNLNIATHQLQSFGFFMFTALSVFN